MIIDIVSHKIFKINRGYYKSQMKLTSFIVLAFCFFMIAVANANTDSLRTKDFQLIVQYDDRSIDVFEIHKIANYSSKDFIHHAYCIFIVEDGETGPNILYTLDGQFDFIDKHGNKMCFEFQINHSSGDKFSLIKCSLLSCAEQTEQTKLSGYYYYLKGNLQDIFQYKSSLMFVIDEKKNLRVELKIKG